MSKENDLVFLVVRARADAAIEDASVNLGKAFALAGVPQHQFDLLKPPIAEAFQKIFMAGFDAAEYVVNSSFAERQRKIQ